MAKRSANASTKPLKQTVLELLRSDAPTDELAHGVFRWGEAFMPHHHLLHVRDEAVVAWNAKTATPGRPRAPLPHEDQITAWLASITDAELATTTAESPLAYVDRKPIAALPFEGFALVHPTVAAYSPGDATSDILPPRTYVAFPCHRSEVPRDADLAWAKTQDAHINWSDFRRGAPCSAARIARYTAPSGTRKAKPKERKPTAPSQTTRLSSAVRARGDWIEVENWNRRVLRFANGEVSLLPDGPSRKLTGEADTTAVLRAFLDRDELPVKAKAKDALVRGDLSRSFEATCGDMEGDVEPVFIEDRQTGDVAARLWVKKKGRVLQIEHEVADSRITDEILPEVILDPYLRVFTGGYYDGKIDRLELVPRGKKTKRSIAMTRARPA